MLTSMPQSMSNFTNFILDLLAASCKGLYSLLVFFFKKYCHISLTKAFKFGIFSFLDRKHIFQRSISSSVLGRFQRLSESFDGKPEVGETLGEDTIEPHVMSEEEIMHKYWKIAVMFLVIRNTMP